VTNVLKKIQIVGESVEGHRKESWFQPDGGGKGGLEEAGGDLAQSGRKKSALIVQKKKEEKDANDFAGGKKTRQSRIP